MTAALFSRRPLAAYVRALFAAGEQGVWYDPSDMSTLYQDAAGTTPVTAVGQPVGLILDKRLGAGRGLEKITNGNFSAGATSWATAGTDATHVVTFTGAGLRYRSDTLSPGLSISQSIGMVVGRTYEVAVTVSSWTSGTLKSDGFTPANISLATGLGTIKYLLVATSTGFSLTRGSTNVDMVISSISVREVFGNHAFQATATSRPTYQRDAAGLAYLSFDGVDDGLQTASIDFSGSDKLSIFAGVRKLNDTAAVIAELSTTAPANAGSFYLVSSEIVGDYSFQTRTSLANSRLSLPGYPAPDTAVLCAAIDISADARSLRRNGGASVTSSQDLGFGMFGNYPLFIGRRGGTSIPFNGRLYGLIIRGALSSAGQVTKAEKYLAKKSGVSL